MSSPFPHDPTWGNTGNVPHHPQSGQPQGGWPGYPQQLQQTYLNNNVAGKPPAPSSWSRVPQHLQPASSIPFQQPPQHPAPPSYPPQESFAPVSAHYSEPVVAEPRQQVFAPPQVEQPQHPQVGSGEDPWSWGWEESSSDSPATSTPNNNFNSVQNYFQPRSIGPVHGERQEPVRGSALTVENVEGGESRVERPGGSTADSVHSGSNFSDVKSDRIPLTSQALREFHNEVYQNGPSGVRHGTDGLTPQWSIESQMSQETVSDDVSPSIAGCSDADSAPMPTWHEETDPEVPARLAALSLADSREVAPPGQQLNKGPLPAVGPIDPPEVSYAFQMHPDVEVDGYTPGPRRSPASLINPPITSSPIPRPSDNLPPPPHGASPAWPRNHQDNQNSVRHAGSDTFVTRSDGAGSRSPEHSAPSPRQGPPPRAADSFGNHTDGGFTVLTENFAPTPQVVPPTRTSDRQGTPPSMRPPPHALGSFASASDSLLPENLTPLPKAPLPAWPSDRQETVASLRLPHYRTTDSSGDGGSHYAPQLPPSASPSWQPGVRIPPRNTEGYNNHADGAFSTGPDLSSAPRPLAHFQPPPFQPSESSTPPTAATVAAQPEPYSPRQTEGYGISFASSSTPTLPYQNRSPISEDVVNLETIPDNKERPDVELRTARFPSSQQPLWYGGGPENQEVAPRGDRNQYLETGRLLEQDNISLNESGTDLDPPPGLSRLVTGENHSVEVGTPPPGLDRMVLGQINEPNQSLPLGLDRMVLGQLNDEPAVGLRRMVPGECSSPEAQAGSPPPGDGAREARVVPGVARDEHAAPPMPVSISISPVGRRQSLSPSPDPQPRLQPQTERSETIGSDHVDVFSANPPDGTNKSSKRREKERVREDVSSDERDSSRRQRDGELYRGRDESPPGDRRRVDWDRRRRSPQRYRDYRDDRRRRRDYEYSDDEDGDASGYYSDRDRRNLSNMSAYRPDDYDRTFPRRDDRARSLKPERAARDRNDERRDVKDRRRGGYERERDRPNDYYRRRPHDDSEDFRGQRSRPSSRNDTSVHRGLTARSDYDRDSDRDHSRSHSKRERDRDPYYLQQVSGFNYDPNMYYYYQYYENLRRTNPAAYAEYYRKYYASSQHGTYSEDRGSVHSGRSSANEETKDRGLESSLLTEEPERPQRLTPTKFTTAHVKGILTVRGQLIKVLAHYPLDGHPASIDIQDSLACLDDVRQQLQEFPGPLVKGVTHKNNVVRYCKLKIKEADSNPDLYDKDSYKLIWELLILLLRQNGTVVGTDISELLMSHWSAYPTPPSPATSHHSINEIPGHQSLQEEEVTNKFRDLLLYGNTKEALEWAMKHGLWGHALFLASKMDQRTYASVMTRFANGLPLNDPLQTLYQLMSGRQPASVTCCVDEKWGDWRPHLAMILSNPSGRPELDQKAITALGDSLGARGALHAAHFCYLMAQAQFGTYAHKPSKVVLIGSPHSLPFHLFATNEAIFATEIFEFACNLADAEFVLQHLQVYKLLVARRLAEVGMTQEAVHYAEVIATTIRKQPSLYPSSLIQEVYDFGSMLKFSDPVYASADNEGCDPAWLLQLLPILSDYQEGVLQHRTFGGSASNLTTCSEPEPHAGLGVSREEQSWENPPEPTFQPQQQWHHDYQPPQQPTAYSEPQPGDNSTYGPSSLETSNYWTPPSPGQWQPPVDEIAPATASDPSADYFDVSRSEVAPTITMPGTGSSRQRSVSQSSDGSRPPPAGQKQPLQQQKGKEQPLLQQQGSGWFGGLWNKFTLKPKNQMILPDDKNPAIVWDPDNKRWMDHQGEGEESSGGSLPPPPMAMPMTPPAPAPGPAPTFSNADPAKPPLPSANLYKMTRGKSLRANYVDVMNPGGNKSQPPPTVAAPDLFPSLSYPAQPTSLFTPSPGDGPLLTPSLPAEPHPQGLSRWSSASSLSREVQSYTGVRRAKGGAGDGTWRNGTLPRPYRK